MHASLGKLIGLAAAVLLLATGPARAERPQAPAPPDHVLFFVDHSGSMNLRHYLAGQPKIAMAKKLLAEFLREMPDGYANVSIHTFSPFATVLEDAPLDRLQALAAVEAIPEDFPVRGRRTTLGDDLYRLTGILAGTEGTVSVVMLTDGYANLGQDPLKRYELIHDVFGERVVFHFVSYAGRQTGQETIRRLRRIDGRGEYAYGDTLLAKGREYDRFLSRALFRFGDQPAAAPAPEGPPGMEPPVEQPLAPAGEAPAPQPPVELDLVVELQGALALAGMDAGPEQVIVLRPADKSPDPAGLGPELAPGLVYVLALLSRNPGLEMAIETHTDSLGEELENLEVCEQWGMLVRDWLAERGVDPARLRVEAYGELRPAFDNADAWGRRLNRRIQFRALPGGGRP